MKIAFIVEAFPRLSETFILNQITGLIDLGHEVDIYASYRPNEGKIHNDVKKYNLISKTYYFHIPKTRKKRIMYAIKICLKNFYKKPLVLLKALNFFKYGSFYNVLNNLFYLAPFLDKNYDIIHCHFGPNGKEFLFLKDIFNFKVKYVTVFHGYDITKILKENGKNFYKDLFKKGDIFLPISNHWGKRLIELGCKKNKIVVHRMGVNINDFKFKPRKRKSNEKIKLLTIARLVKKKGLEFGIQAVAKLIKKYPNLEYKIAGDGPLRNELEALITKFNVQDKIKLLGWMEHGEVRRLMQEAHIFILPSITSQDGDQEGIPVVLMEAQAVGLPIISTWHSGIPELVIDGKSGFLVSERDVDALAEKLEYLIKHPEVWPEMGRFGRKFVEEHYDIKKLNKRLVEIYQNLLVGNKS